MADNVFFFDLRQGDTNNFEKLTDENYLLWNRKTEKIEEGDYCIVYNKEENILLTTQVIKENIPVAEDENGWFVEFAGKKYYFENGEESDEFLAFSKINEHTPDADLTISPYGGITLLTQSKETRFKKEKIPKVYQIIEDNEILKLLNRYNPQTIVNAVVDALHSLGEATPEEIYEYITENETYHFATDDSIHVLKNQISRRCKESGRSDKASNILFYKKETVKI